MYDNEDRCKQEMLFLIPMRFLGVTHKISTCIKTYIYFAKCILHTDIAIAEINNSIMFKNTFQC